MNNKIWLRLFLFFVWIEVAILWVCFYKLSLFMLWLLNTIVILLMFFDISIDSYYQKVNNFFFKKTFDNFEWQSKKFLLYLKKLQQQFLFIIEVLRYFYLKWWFVLSLVIFLLAILDYYILHKFWINIVWSGIFFVLWMFIMFDKIKNGEIYIWNRLLTPKDLIFMLALILIFVFFVFLWKLSIYERLFYSLFLWFVFYIIAVFWLNYENFDLKFFSRKIVVVFLIILLLSFLYFLYNKVPVIKNKFTIYKIVYKEKEVPIYKEKIVYKEFTPSITYIAPNWKRYEIIITQSWVYFTWYGGIRKYFSSFQEARQVIDKYNQSVQNLNDNIEESIKKMNNSNLYENRNLNNNESGIVNMFLTLLNDTENTKISTDKTSYLTYYDVIPWLIKKYKLDSSSKPDINFKYISKNDKNYEYFKTAYYYKMFWRNSNPYLKVRCRNFAVLIGLSEWWDVKYNRTNVFDVFYKEAIKRWYPFNFCCKTRYDFLTEWKKTCILK